MFIYYQLLIITMTSNDSNAFYFKHYSGDKRADEPIKVDPLKGLYSNDRPIAQKWSDDELLKFINSLSYDYFILAGNSVANMIENIPLQGDLDFWVLCKTKYLSALDEFSKHATHYDIYPSMIEIYVPNMPKINLILSDMSADQTIDNFDLDYCRCYWTPKTGCVAYEECLLSIFTKTINDPISYGEMRPNRVLKALQYGYSFNRQFWYYFDKMLIDKNIIPTCQICRITCDKNWLRFGPDMWHGCRHCRSWHTPYPVSLNQLNMEYFEQIELDIKISDPTDITQTLEYLQSAFKKASEQLFANTIYFKLPKLFTLSHDQYELVKLYANKIILVNPVRNTNYAELLLNGNNA